MMPAAIRLHAIITCSWPCSWESESGLTLGQFTMSLGVIALGLAMAYFLGSALGEDFREIVFPAFEWR